MRKNIVKFVAWLLQVDIRFTNSVLHVTVGLDAHGNPPTQEDLDHMTKLFQAADADPTGAIVVTSDRVQVQTF